MRTRTLLDYGALLEEGAARLGLVGRGDRGHILSRHVTQALEPDLVARLGPKGRVLDVGSGGGIPGIPWAIVRDDLQIQMLEPRLRRAAFLERAVLTLRIENAGVFTGTLEEFARRQVTTPWSAAVTRGVRWTPLMVRAVEVLLAEDGVVLRFGSDRGEVGIEAVPLAGPGNHAVQIWPRSMWDRLPTAS